MKKSLIYVLLTMVLVIVTSPFVFAAPEAAAAPAGTVDYTKAIIVSCSLFVAGLRWLLVLLAPLLGMGNGLNGATNAVGRNPEAQGKILLTMMVGLAMIESLAIYALVIALIVLYANPLLKYLG